MIEAARINHSPLSIESQATAIKALKRQIHDECEAHDGYLRVSLEPLLSQKRFSKSEAQAVARIVNRYKTHLSSKEITDYALEQLGMILDTKLSISLGDEDLDQALQDEIFEVLESGETLIQNLSDFQSQIQSLLDEFDKIEHERLADPRDDGERHFSIQAEMDELSSLFNEEEEADLARALNLSDSMDLMLRLKNREDVSSASFSDLDWSDSGGDDSSVDCDPLDGDSMPAVPHKMLN